MEQRQDRGTYFQTLHITFPVGQTLALALAILVVLAVGSEFALRQPAVQERLLLPSIGGDWIDLDVKLMYLEREASRREIDCFLIGSSAVFRGLEPASLNRAYAAVSGGDTLHCFNLGLRTLMASGASDLVAYLEEQYHPRLIVYGLTPREVNSQTVSWSLSRAVLNDMPWWRYQQHDRTLKGWALEHLSLYRYFTAYQQPLTAFWRPSEILTMRRNQYSGAVDNAGFRAHRGFFALPMSDAERTRLDRAFGAFEPDPDEVAALDALLARHHPPQTTVMLVEIPIHRVVVDEIMGAERYATFVSVVTQLAEARGVPYWLTTERNMIALDGWYDGNHLNNFGATSFSTWLGEQLGQAVKRGEIVLPDA